VDGAGGRVRVWYHTDHQATDRATAGHIASELETVIWPRVTALMDNRQPVSDAGLQNNGGNGRLDVVLLDLEYYGLAAPIVPQGSKCINTAIYLEIDRSLSGNILDGTIAHEFMHIVQWTYQASCWPDEYLWMDEATATWVEHYVYPGYDTEHEYVSEVTDHPEESLDSTARLHTYGAYLFFFFLHEGYSERWIPAIYAAGTTNNSLLAVENGLGAAGSTSLAARWPEFARRLWNQAPVDQFNNWDAIVEHAKAGRQVMKPALAAVPDDTLQMPAELPHLSSRYYHIMFTDDRVRSVSFMNGLKYKLVRNTTADGLVYIEPVALPEADTKGLNIQIIYRVRGNDFETIDVTDAAAFDFCRDQAAGRVDEMVVIFSNTDFENRSRSLKPAGIPPMLWFSNAGCWKWQGTVSLTFDADGCNSTTMTADLSWETDFPGVLAMPPDDYPEESTAIAFEPRSGTVTWNMAGTDCGDCTVSGSKSWPIGGPNFDFMALYVFTPSGPYHRSLDMYGIAQDLGFEVTERWNCPEPEGNFDFTHPLDFYVDLLATEHGIRISADGSRISGRVDQWDAVVTVDLTAQRE